MLDITLVKSEHRTLLPVLAFNCLFAIYHTSLAVGTKKHEEIANYKKVCIIPNPGVARSIRAEGTKIQGFSAVLVFGCVTTFDYK